MACVVCTVLSNPVGWGRGICSAFVFVLKTTPWGGGRGICNSRNKSPPYPGRAGGDLHWYSSLNLLIIIHYEYVVFLPHCHPSASSQSDKAHQEFLEERLPNSAFFDISVISDQNSPYPDMLPRAEEFANHIMEVGQSLICTIRIIILF